MRVLHTNPPRSKTRVSTGRLSGCRKGRVWLKSCRATFLETVRASDVVLVPAPDCLAGVVGGGPHPWRSTRGRETGPRGRTGSANAVGTPKHQRLLLQEIDHGPSLHQHLSACRADDNHVRQHEAISWHRPAEVTVNRLRIRDTTLVRKHFRRATPSR